MKEIKEIGACGEWIVAEARKVEAEEKKTESGLILPGKQANGQNMNNPNSMGKVTVDFYIYSIGNKVPEDIGYKVGDMVILNDYDVQSFSDGKDKIFCVCHYKNVKCVIKT